MSTSVDIDPTMDPTLKVFSGCLVVGFYLCSTPLSLRPCSHREMTDLA